MIAAGFSFLVPEYQKEVIFQFCSRSCNLYRLYSNVAVFEKMN